MNSYQKNPLLINEGILTGKGSIPRNAFAWGLKRARNPKKVDVMPEIISLVGHGVAPGATPLAIATHGASLAVPSVVLRTIPRSKRPKLYKKIIDGSLNSEEVITKWALKHGIDPFELMKYVPIK